MRNIFSIFVKALVHSPVYPHWLVDGKMNMANNLLLNNIHGDILEVGAGDGKRKLEFLRKYKKITSYTATDHSSWDDEFQKINKRIKKYFGAGEILFGYRERIKLDKICSAVELPFENEVFDYHLSFEVLEHIGNPQKYFSEAARVLRPGGVIMFSVPFLYRMHGGGTDQRLDFFMTWPRKII